MLKIIFTSVLFATWGGTILSCFVLLLNRLFENRLNVKLRYLLLALVLVRFLFPIMPESPISVLNCFPHPITLIHSLQQKENAIPSLVPESGEQSALAEQTTKQQNSMNENTHFNIIKSSEEKQNNFSSFDQNPMITLAALFWVFGVLMVWGSRLVFYCLFHHFNNKNSVQNDNNCNNILMDCKKKLAIKQKINIKLASNLHSPIITGYFFPTIYIPKDLVSKIDDLELSHIILHELVHWKRVDALRTLISFVAVSLHWFNPMAWFVLKKIKEERELLCDLNTLKVLGEEQTSSYGSTIIHVSQLQSRKTGGKLYHTAFFTGTKQIKRRIIMIKQFQNGFTKSFTLVSVALLILLSMVTMTNAIGTQELLSQQKTLTNNNFTLVNGSYQYFDSLERLSRYAGFDYLVPNTLPKEFKVENFYLNKMGKSANKNNVVQINFWYSNMDGKMVDGAVEQHFNYMVCKDSLIDYLNKAATPSIVKNPDKSPKPVKIGGLDGYQLKTYGKITAYTDDDQKIEGFNQSDYFIWKYNELWYAVQYTYINTFNGEKPYSLLDLSEADIAKMATSLTSPAKVTNNGYFSTDKTPSYAVYDNFDLERIKKDWGLQPILPLELPGLKAKSAYMTNAFMADSNFGVFCVKYSLSSGKDSDTVAEYSQSNSSLEYKLAEKAYLNQKAKATKEPTIPWRMEKINEKTVYYSIDPYHGTQYVWDKASLDVYSSEGIDEQSILKALVK